MNENLNKLLELKENPEEIIIKDSSAGRHFLTRFFVLFVLIITSLIFSESNIVGVQTGYGYLLLVVFLQVIWFLFIIFELIMFQMKKNYLLRTTNFILLLAAMFLYLIVIKISLLIIN
ncbi:hypothetical protein OIU83_16690 [Flavobacterium sp. LS1R49]|uniref:Uncharacterized protein n=1 Tax=Flavobacterium shii TaxID=2987687 RepID=A0A9X3C699_9FLAO|nr:hypothetical protein [Flavobacterium shii]MCV9929307.1 hypothetical protein [Flavobacterium shii]